MISGPEGTPYSNGLFLFDVIFPADYPRVPPKVTNEFHDISKDFLRYVPFVSLFVCKYDRQDVI